MRPPKEFDIDSNSFCSISNALKKNIGGSWKNLNRFRRQIRF
jgi:hypothetical protein